MSLLIYCFDGPYRDLYSPDITGSSFMISWLTIVVYFTLNGCMELTFQEFLAQSTMLTLCGKDKVVEVSVLLH